ncbi:transcription initiation factor TFIID subunit 3 isoform X2 [Cloeon dipterum]|uniref:transcription initiation factor TFIID subunit 3 isoform X2 n=1 Tax=Cloeon dipterum TaxID=197152 RepID=UPI003220301F
MKMDEYTRKILVRVVGQVCSQLGWHSIHQTPLDIMVDLLHRQLQQICVQTHRYSEQFNQSQPNLDHLGLAMQDLGIRLSELEDFVRNVESSPLPNQVPKYPLPKESHLNFLKPGSNEVVHRPVHVHEHLPPMHPDLEENNQAVALTGDASAAGDANNGAPSSPSNPNSPAFKRPTDLLETPAMKRVRMAMEEEGGRTLREISSVIMTTSGFLSPAIEGKLPESKPPSIPSEFLDQPKPVPPPVVPATSSSKDKKKLAANKTPPIAAKKKDTASKRKLETPKPPIPKVEKKEEHLPPPPKKKKQVPPTMKELDKLKALKQITVRKLPPAPMPMEKLPVDPDKQKLNIFKKIPKVKEDMLKSSRESSPNLTITEVPQPPPQPRHEEARRLANIDSVIDSVISEPKIEMIVEEEVIFSDTFSPPSTPSAPKTPEILSKADRLAEKRRKREKQKQKSKATPIMVEDPLDDDIIEEPIERPRTPQALIPPSVFPFMSRFPAPGLIPPPPMTSPLLAGLPFPGKEGPPVHPAMPNLPLPPPMFMQQKNELDILEPSTSAVTEEVVEVEVKEHKKEKKEEKKVKKKKDKKDKNKSKEKGEKKREEKKEKIKEKKDKKEKKKDREKIVLKISKLKQKRDERAETSSPAVPKITLKFGPPSPRPPTPDAPRKLVIKPVVEPEPENPPELAKFAALITRPPKPKIKEPEPVKRPAPVAPVAAETVAFYHHDGGQKKSSASKSSSGDISKFLMDATGNKVWICPACVGPDDGTPMIGCDGCDAWYHWACVGIQVPPDEDVDWYCQKCIARKMSSMSDKKKKKNKKKA